MLAWILLGWCVAAVGLSLVVGPWLHRSAVLAERHERIPAEARRPAA